MEVVDAGVRYLEKKRSAGIEPRLGEIFHHFMLRVNRYALSTGERREINVVSATAETQVDSVMLEADAIQARAEPELVHQVDGSLLQHAGANALFHILAAAIFDDDGIDAFALEEMRKKQTGGTGANDADLRAHARPTIPDAAARGNSRACWNRK